VATVELRGNADLRKALRAFAPDLEKELKAELRTALLPVVRKAKGYVVSNPMRNWNNNASETSRFPRYNAYEVSRGIGYSTGVSKVNKNGFSSMAKIFNKSAAGAIYEQAGIVEPGRGRPWVGPKGPAGNKYSHSNWEGAGEQFIKNLPPLTSSLKGRGRKLSSSTPVVRCKSSINFSTPIEAKALPVLASATERDRAAFSSSAKAFTARLL